VGAVAAALVTGFSDPEWWLGAHEWAGYSILALLLFRFVWAVYGSEYSRIASFAYRPTALAAHLRGLALLRPPPYLGHNPAGAVMVVALALVLAALVVTGLLVEGGEEKTGPLAGVLTYAVGYPAKRVHEILTWLLIAMIVGHVVGVMVESLLTRENLVAAMITGLKRLPAERPRPTLRQPRWRTASIALAALGVPILLALVWLSRLPPLGVPRTAIVPTYARECGACHWAFHPALLPRASWRAMLAELGDHFGEDASLDAAASTEIAGFLKANAAESWDNEIGNRFREVAPAMPQRVTAVPYWVKKHAEVSEAVFERKSVGGKGNCAACHRDADTGRFDDDAIDIPAE